MKKSAILLLALALSSCTQQAPRSRAVTDLKTLTISLGSSEIATQYTTAIRAEQFVDIYPQVTGVITDIKVKEGAKVKKGETLFIIDQVPYTAALSVAEANVKSAEASVKTAALNARNAKELYKEQIISENEMEITQNTLLEAEANLALMEANVVSARNNLSYTVITSPVSGVAGMIPYRVGALVSSSISDPLVSVASNDKMYGYFSISERQAITLSQQRGGDIISGLGEVSLILNNGTKYPYAGQIDAVSGTVNRSTGAVTMRAVFENPEGLLRDGGNGSVLITDKHEGVVVIPMIATFEIQNRVLAYKIVDGKAVSTQLTVFPYNNGKEYVVEAGLEVGDVIVAEGAGLVREGQQVINDKKE